MGQVKRVGHSLVSNLATGKDSSSLVFSVLLLLGLDEQFCMV